MGAKTMSLCERRASVEAAAAVVAAAVATAAVAAVATGALLRLMLPPAASLKAVEIETAEAICLLLWTLLLQINVEDAHICQLNGRQCAQACRDARTTPKQ